MNSIKPQSVDRIECCFNKYFSNSDFAQTYIQKTFEVEISAFLNVLLSTYKFSKKEFDRIYQIVHGVFDYSRSINLVTTRRIDWLQVKNLLLTNKLVDNSKNEIAIASDVQEKIIHSVLFENIYPQKRCSSLCVCLNFYLGLRVGELAALKWCDVDFEHNRVNVHSTFVKHFNRDSEGNKEGHIEYLYQDTTKSKNGIRSIPLVPESITILKYIYQAQLNKNMYSLDTFLCDDGNDSILLKSLERCCARLSVLCDVPHIHSHLIRKTFITNLAEAGVPSKFITNLAGHSEIRTTEKFYILKNRDELEIARGYMKEAL